MLKKIILLIAIIASLPVLGQQIKTTYTAAGNLETPAGNKAGKVGSVLVEGSHTIPLSVKRDDAGGMKIWQLTVNGKYASFDNRDGAGEYNVDKVINGGAMLTYIHPINRKWNVVSTLGASIHALPDYIRLGSVALTGGAIFMYNVNKNLNVGVGAVATTTYGEPVIIPFPFITWQKNGKYRVELNMQGVPRFSISTALNKTTDVEFSPFAMERLSAVVSVDGRHRLYSNNRMFSALEISHKITDGFSIEATAGYTYRNTIRYRERSFKDFWANLFDSDSRCKIKPSANFSISLKYKFR